MAIVAATFTMACNSESKKDNEKEQGNEVTAEERKQNALDEISALETTLAELGETPISEVINKRSYAQGAIMGLSLKMQFASLELDMDLFKKHVLDFYASGDVESEEFAKDNESFMMYYYTMFGPYEQAKYKRQAYEDGGVTEGLPELPELFNEQYTKDNITRILANQMGASLQNIDGIDFGWLFKGFDDAYLIESIESQEDIDNALAMTTSEISQEMVALQQEMQKKAEEEYQKMLADNLEASKEWLSEIEKMEGVKKSESGLLYRVEREGNGAYPTADTDIVEVHYEGTLRNGEVFDSSYKRNETAKFPLNGVIKGWTEGLKYINEGGEITLWIPTELAYGTNVRPGGPIGPNEALKFKVELIKVTKTETEAEVVEPEVAEAEVAEAEVAEVEVAAEE